MAKRGVPTLKTVHIRANVSFMDIREGDESVCPLDDTVQGWINAGFVTAVGGFNDGENPAGSSSAEPDDEGGEPGEGGA